MREMIKVGETVVEIYTDKKGSNPGGKCQITTARSEFDAYLKYCPSSRLARYNDQLNCVEELRPMHQPIYEAITLFVAERMGLRVPPFYVLRNEKNNVTFSFEELRYKRAVRTDMPYYSVSQLIEHPPVRESEKRENALAREKLYRDLILVSDVSNKAQNFRYDEDSDRVTYLDLGCSFTNAIGGVLLPSTIHIPKVDKKDRKSAQQLKQKGIITTNKGEEKRLEDILELLPSTLIPTLNPDGKSLLGNLLTSEEIEEIGSIFAVNLLTIKRKYKADARILF